MTNKEKIISAAIRYTGKDQQGNAIEVEMMGISHDHAIENSLCALVDPDGNIELGFMTNKSRFVTPCEALDIIGWANQLRFKDRKYLLPEDLY